METKLKQLLKTIKLNESMLSMLFGVVTVILIGVLVVRAYQSRKPAITAQSEQTEQVSAEAKEEGQNSLPDSVKVAKGDTLWKISEKNYGSGYNWVDIAKENKLKSANVITEGQELKLPKTVTKIAVSSKTTVKEVASTNKVEGDSYTVVKGDNLWGISVRAYADGYKWSTIAKANNLKNPHRIMVGQVIKLPR